MLYGASASAAFVAAFLEEYVGNRYGETIALADIRLREPSCPLDSKVEETRKCRRIVYRLKGVLGY